MSQLATSNLSAGTFTPEQRFAGESDLITKPMTLVTGQNLAAGAVLGRITASGKLTLCNSGAGDGSQTPVAILCEATDASAADQVTPVWVAGEFNVDALVFHASFTTDALKLNAFGVSGSIILRKLGYSGG